MFIIGSIKNVIVKMTMSNSTWPKWRPYQKNIYHFQDLFYCIFKSNKSWILVVFGGIIDLTTFYESVNTCKKMGILQKNIGWIWIPPLLVVFASNIIAFFKLCPPFTLESFSHLMKMFCATNDPKFYHFIIVDLGVDNKVITHI